MRSSPECCVRRAPGPRRRLRRPEAGGRLRNVRSPAEDTGRGASWAAKAEPSGATGDRRGSRPSPSDPGGSCALAWGGVIRLSGE
ncbi:MAG: hypothetical protein EPN98_10970 [Phenylobacterium sp.]|nr:MAG: hypothetical protein EPN98_10970 [Phenylobacterium sp.]